MKIFNTIQELWSYCLYCPICRDICRDMHISMGPDDVFSVSRFNKKDHILFLNCVFKSGKVDYNIKYSINCLNNSFTYDISKPFPAMEQVTKAASGRFYFYIHSNCRRCDATNVNSSDLELIFNKKIITEIGVETEMIYFLKENPRYSISMEYDRNIMSISKCFEDEETGEIIDDNKPFNFPIIDFDYSNPKKVLNRIKTLLVFS